MLEAKHRIKPVTFQPRPSTLAPRLYHLFDASLHTTTLFLLLPVYTLQCQHRLSTMATHTSVRRKEHQPPPVKKKETTLKSGPTAREKNAFDVVC